MASREDSFTVVTIRQERADERADVEAMIRRAFYNLYTPGCGEHYLAHVLRGHEDFIPELDLVLELDGRVIGNIMYTKASLIGKNGTSVPAVTFGPLCVDPAYQRRGYGRMLVERSCEIACQMGYEAVVIFGSPLNYVGYGFVSCKKHGVHAEGDVYPAAMLVRELREGVLSGGGWTYRDSPAMHIREEDAEAYDAKLPPIEKRWQPSQEEFYIMSQAVLG